MTFSFEQTAILQFLKQKQPELYGKVIELRTAAEGWLAYIPQTFPHYTRHTVLHSDAILVQMSKLLFEDGTPQGQHCRYHQWKPTSQPQRHIFMILAWSCQMRRKRNS
jgi:hypothetical protein